MASKKTTLSSNSSLTKKKTPSKKKRTKFNNIKHSSLRQKFYDALDGKIHTDFIRKLFDIALHIEEKICGIELKHKRYKFTFLPSHENHCMEIFGGSVFYSLFLEADKLGLFNSDDMEIISNFIEYKTVDIDASIHYEVKPSLESLSEKKLNIVLKDLSEQYKEVMILKLQEVISENPGIGDFLNFLSTERKFKGFPFIEDTNITPYLGPNGIFSLNISYNTNGPFEIRPQINTCVETDNFCDHILEILTRDDGPLKNVNVYNLTEVRPFLGRNIILSCMQNIDRLYRLADEKITKPYSEKKTLLALNNTFREDPTYKTKYMQGFYRVQLVHLILTKLLSRRSPKFNNLKDLFKLSPQVCFSISSFVSSSKTMIGLLPLKYKKNEISFFNRLRYLDEEKFKDLHFIEDILRRMIELWLTIHEKITTNFGRHDVIFTEYVAVPEYSSNDKSSNRLYSRVGREFDVDFEDENWEKTITNQQILLVLKRIGLDPAPITSVSRNIILKKIKKKLNLT
jgi:hypothetical protein